MSYEDEFDNNPKDSNILENYSENILYKGAREDLIDLIFIWIKSYGKENLLDHPYAVFQELDYHIKYKKIFATAIKYIYGDKLLDPKFVKKFSPYIRG